MAGNISMGARREVVSAVVERYRSAGRREKGRILHELTAVTGWHRKHSVRALRGKPPTQAAETVPRKRRYDAASRDAVAHEQIVTYWCFSSIVVVSVSEPRMQRDHALFDPVVEGVIERSCRTARVCFPRRAPGEMDLRHPAARE
jgi:hypothetical protein